MKSFFKASGKRRNYESWKKFCCNEKVTKYSYICADHFADEYFVNKQNYSQGLKPYAVPTLKGPSLEAEYPFDNEFAMEQNDVSSDVRDDPWDTEMVTGIEINDENHDLYCDPENVTGEVVLCDEEKQETFTTKKRKLNAGTSAVDHDHNYKFDYTRYVLLNVNWDGVHKNGAFEFLKAPFLKTTTILYTITVYLHFLYCN